MKNEPRIVLLGSFRTLPNYPRSGELDPLEQVEISVRVRRKKPLVLNELTLSPLSHEAYVAEFGASSEDVKLVENFAAENGLSVTEFSFPRRTVNLMGTIQKLEEAFAVKLFRFEDPAGHSFRGRSGNIHIPRKLADVIEGVFGLDNRVAASAKFQYAKRHGAIIRASASTVSYTGDQLARIYNFPSGVTGKGQTIGIIELGGGFTTQDISTYFIGLGLKPPSVNAVLVDGATNSPSSPNGPDAEVMLDIEVAGAVAPESNLVVYFAPNTDAGFLDCVTTAIHDSVNNPSVISLSWGSPEANFTAQSTNSFNQALQSAAALGITVCVAAGDQGSSDGLSDGQVHVDFPASSPYALACGGTKLTVTGDVISSEVVWHESDTSATGGGVSEIFPLPDYQLNAGVPLSINTQFKGRGLPDVAANADPTTGYKILVDGQSAVIGGTSAVAPLMAGLIARINEQTGARAGYIHPALYANPSVCRDITEGDNKTTSAGTGYSAAGGWDACTGWGVLSGLPAAISTSPSPLPSPDSPLNTVAAVQSIIDQNNPLS